MFLSLVELFVSTVLTTQFGWFRFIGPLASRIFSFALIFVVMLILMKITIRANVTWKNALITSVVGALIFEVAKAGFAFYVREMMDGSWFSIYGDICLFTLFMHC